MRSAARRLLRPTLRTYCALRPHHVIALPGNNGPPTPDARLGARARQLGHRPDERVEAVGRAAGGKPVGAEIAHLVLELCKRRVDVLHLALRIHRGDGSARSHLPRVACTVFSGTDASTSRMTARTISPPWFTSATSVSAWSLR